MDIVELSLKMQANLLDSHSSIPYLKPNSNENSCPRLTRSQANRDYKLIVKDLEVHLESKKSNRKVDEVEKIYLNKATKTVHKNLETIYEHPVLKKGSMLLLGTSKVKRSIYLDREFRITSKQKSKVRKKKIKKLGKRMKPFKISDEEFKSRMLRIENYLNENDDEIQFKNKNCNIKFENFGNKYCLDLKSGNVEVNGSDIIKNNDLELKYKVISE